MIVKTLTEHGIELEHKGILFRVTIHRLEDGRMSFTPMKGWNSLMAKVNQDGESLMEELDDAIYNVLPELWDEQWDKYLVF